MSNISPRPWRIKDTDILDANGELIDFHSVPYEGSVASREDWEHIVKAVNEHDSLVAEVERLEQIAGGVISNSNGIVTITTNHYEDLRQEVEAYKEKEKICTLCEQHPSWQIRAEKAEAEVERLRKFLKQVDDVACSFPNWWFESNEEYKSFQEKLDELIKDGEC
jgi:Xaa-Pro aminopeptidase